MLYTCGSTGGRRRYLLMVDDVQVKTPVCRVYKKLVVQLFLHQAERTDHRKYPREGKCLCHTNIAARRDNLTRTIITLNHFVFRKVVPHCVRY